MHFGSEDDLFHFRHLTQCASRYFFTDTHRVHVGGVEEVDAKVERFLIEGSRVDFVEDPWSPFRSAVGHAAETNPRDLQSAAAQLSVLHQALRSSSALGTDDHLGVAVCRL